MPGIDLGTSNSAIAIIENGKPRIIKYNQVDDVMPSVVFMDKAGGIVVGRNAVNSTLLVEERDGNGASRWKTRMGQDDRYHFSAAKKTLTGPELSSLVIKELLKAYRRDTSNDTTSCVITIPSKFDQPANDATREAARLAGLDHYPTLQEPIAAALAYGFGASDSRANWMVFDLGGGTLDVSLMVVRDGVLSILPDGQAGDANLGGSNFDRELMEFVIGPMTDDKHGKNDRFRSLQSDYSPLRKRYKLDNFSEISQRVAWHRLMIAVENAKIALSRKNEAVVELDGPLCKDEAGKDVIVEFAITRSAYEKLIAADVERAAHICQMLLNRNRMSSKDLDQVILVGGPTKTPYVQKILSERLNVALDVKVDPMTAVALGAALHAEMTEPAGGSQPKAITSERNVTLTVQAERASSIPLCTVAGMVASDTVPVDSTTAEIVREDNLWSSGQLAVDETGFFTAEVALIEKGKPFQSRFTTIVRDSRGVELAKIEEPNIWHPFPQTDAVLANTMSVALVGNQTEALLDQGDTLPRKGKKVQVVAAKGIRRGFAEDVLVIPIVEAVQNLLGNEVRTRADCNVHIGQLEVRGDSTQLTRDIPKGAEIELSLKIDASRAIEVIAFIPLLDEEFAGFQRGGTYGASPTDIESRFAEEQTRLTQIRKLHAHKALPISTRALQVIDQLKTIESIETDIARVKAGETKDISRAWKRVLEFAGTVQEVWEAQGRLRLDERLEQLWNAAVDQERGDVDALRKELNSSTGEISPEQLAKLEKETSELDLKIRHRPYYSLVLYVVALSGQKVNHEQNLAFDAASKFLDGLIERGAPESLTSSDLTQIEAHNQKLRNLYPDLQERVAKWLADNPGRGPSNSLASGVARR